MPLTWTFRGKLVLPGPTGPTPSSIEIAATTTGTGTGTVTGMPTMAAFSHKRGLTIVLSTHSEAILRRMPLGAVRLVTRSESGVRVDSVGARAVYLSALGAPAVPSCLVLVEDRVALAVARAIIARCAPHLLGEIAFDYSPDGESAIRELLTRWPGGSQRLIGLFDGDQRMRMPKDFAHPHAFLPGDRSPEEELRDVLLANSDVVAKGLGVDGSVLEQTLSIAQGLDLHDWLHGVSAAVAVDVNTLVRVVVAAWYEDPSASAGLQETATSLDELVKHDRAGSVGNSKRSP